jgi:uncharacterized protein YecT (DUF1311 family)
VKTFSIRMAVWPLGGFLTVALALAAHPASAINCARATSEIEQTICEDEQARAADQKLGAAFDRLGASLPDDQRSGLRASQIEWIRERDLACRASQADDLPACLVTKSDQRRRFLEGRPTTGDVEQARYKPVFIFRSGTKRKAKLSVEAIKFIGPDTWQTKVNAIVDELIKRAISDAELSDRSSNERGLYEVELSVSIPFATPRLVSVRASYESSIGQAHSFHSSKNFNIELPSGRELTFDGLFDPAKANELVKYCHSEIVKKKVQMADLNGLGDDKVHNVDLSEVEGGLKDLSSWTFSESGAEIDYGDYGFGGYGKCMCTCVVSYAQLRAAVRRDPPFP